MIHLLATVSILLYVVSSVLMLVQLWRSESGGGIQSITRALLVVAVILHTITVYEVMTDPRYVLLDNGADYFLGVSWALAATFVLLRRKLNYPIVGAFLIPAVVLFMGSSSYLLHTGSSSVLLDAATREAPHSVALSIAHAIPALISVVSLALALVVSVVFLIVERRIKRRERSALTISGPNLQFLDRLNHRLVQVGFGAITLVILSGSLWAMSERTPILRNDTSVVSSVVVWLLLACILHARLVLRWSPKKLCRLTVVVTSFFFITVFAVLVIAGRLTHAELWS